MLQQRRGREMHDGGNQASGDGYRQTDEAFLIDFGRALSQRPRPRGLHIESRQTKPAAYHKHESDEPGDLAAISPSFERRAESPDIGEERRSQSKRNNVCQRIELYANLRG